MIKIRHRIKELIMVNVIGAVVILGGSYVLISQELGLMGIGWAYLFGQGVVSAVYLMLSFRKR